MHLPFFKTLMALLLIISSTSMLAQINPTPYLGDININNGRVSADWTFERVAGTNNIVMKNDNGYLSEVHYNRPKYSADKGQAVVFFIDEVRQPWTSPDKKVIRLAQDPNQHYTHKGGNYVLHGFMLDGSSWMITSRRGIDPAPLLGNVNVSHYSSTLPWTLERVPGTNQIVMKDDNGYVKVVKYNGNDYTDNIGEAAHFYIDNTPASDAERGKYVIQSVADSSSYYTRIRGNWVMHAYVADGSALNIEKR